MNRIPRSMVYGLVSAFALVLLLATPGYVLANASMEWLTEFGSGSSSASTQETRTPTVGLFELGATDPPGAGGADILGAAEQGGPDWGDLFNADRSLRDDYPAPSGNGIPDYQELYGGTVAVFSADDVSLGAGFESTAVLPDGRVYNGVADPDHDLGNAYVYSTVNTSGEVVLYAGAERLGSGDSYLEFEFNQSLFRLGHGGYGRGEPWSLTGSRSIGDVLVRLDFAGGTVTTTASSWDGAGWSSIDTLSVEGCSGTALCMVCNQNDVDGGPWANYDTGINPEVISAQRFFEWSVNLDVLIGSHPSYKTVRLRTPQDAAFSYFGEGN